MYHLIILSEERTSQQSTMEQDRAQYRKPFKTASIKEIREIWYLVKYRVCPASGEYSPERGAKDPPSIQEKENVVLLRVLLQAASG